MDFLYLFLFNYFILSNLGLNKSFFSYIFLGDSMKKILCCLLLFILVIPIKVKAFETSATSAILMDMDCGRILYSKDIHNKRSVASISKIMTAILAVESGKLNDVVTIGEEINDAYGSGIYIKIDEQMKLEDLVYGLMLRSGNDAALAIAKYVGGTVDNFVVMMNNKAKEIGMTNTIFNNPSGLDEDKGNYSTAYDMAILTSYAMKNKDFAKIVGTKTHTVKTNANVYSWINKNKLLFSKDYITGGKTGYTEIAKRTLVSTASKDNLNLVVVTLNDGNDWADHTSLYEEAFNTFKNYQILNKGEIHVLDDKYYSNKILYLKNDYSYTLSDLEKDNVYLKILLEKKREYKDNDSVGVVNFYLGDKKLHEEAIYVKDKKEEIKKQNLFSKILGWFKND